MNKEDNRPRRPRGSVSEAVLELIVRAGRPVTSREVGMALPDVPCATISQTCKNLADHGHLKVVGRETSQNGRIKFNLYIMGEGPAPRARRRGSTPGKCLLADVWR